MKPMFTVVLNESVKLAPSPDLVAAKRLAIEHLNADPTLTVRIDFYPTVLEAGIHTIRYDAEKELWGEPQTLP
jgi:hypothetical protein